MQIIDLWTLVANRKSELKEKKIEIVDDGTLSQSVKEEKKTFSPLHLKRGELVDKVGHYHNLFEEKVKRNGSFWQLHKDLQLITNEQKTILKVTIFKSSFYFPNRNIKRIYFLHVFL